MKLETVRERNAERCRNDNQTITAVRTTRHGDDPEAISLPPHYIDHREFGRRSSGITPFTIDESRVRRSGILARFDVEPVIGL